MSILLCIYVCVCVYMRDNERGTEIESIVSLCPLFECNCSGSSSAQADLLPNTVEFVTESPQERP